MVLKRCTAALVVAVVAAFVIRAAASRMFYPRAPSMPAEVNVPMPELLARLDSLLSVRAPRVRKGLRPGLTDKQVTELERSNSLRLPDDLKVIYRWHDGSQPSTETAGDDLLPIARFLPLEEALAERTTLARQSHETIGRRLLASLFLDYRASWLSVLSDGAGDGYWYDPNRSSRAGNVFESFTELTYFVFFPSFKNVVAGIAKCYEDGIFPIKADASPEELRKAFSRANVVWYQFGRPVGT